MSKTAAKVIFEVPGQHEYEGVQYMPIVPKTMFEELRQFQMGEGDVLFSTYPKSGTPFLSDLLYLIHHKADVEKVKTVPHGILVPFLDHVTPDYNPIVELPKAAKPRLLKIHLPANLFLSQINQGKVKVVVMLRNPKDNLAAYYNFYRMTPGPIRYQGTWEEFFEMFKARQLFVGDWFEYALSWWRLRERENVLVLKYEDIKASPEKYVHQVAQFCGQDLSSDETGKISRYIQNEAGEEFEIGSWKQVFTKDQNEYFDEQFREKLDGTGLTFENMIF